MEYKYIAYHVPGFQITDDLNWRLQQGIPGKVEYSYYSDHWLVIIEKTSESQVVYLKLKYKSVEQLEDLTSKPTIEYKQ